MRRLAAALAALLATYRIVEPEAFRRAEQFGLDDSWGWAPPRRPSLAPISAALAGPEA